MLAGKSAAAAQGQVARATHVVLPIVQIRFTTFPITLIVLVGDCYSMIGPTLQLAAETVGSRLRRPTTCSSTASLFACAVSCALTSTRPQSARSVLSSRRRLS